MKEDSPRVLLAEDDPQIRRSLTVSLTALGCEVIPAANGGEALAAAQGMRPDIVLLDLGLPDRDGKDVLRELRSRYPGLPVIVVSARSDESEKVAAFDAGADDYVTKPFGTAELAARIRTALRHARGRSDTPPQRLNIGELCIDFNAHAVSLRGEAIKLTPKEFRLLATLAEAPGKMFSHRTLMHKVWGPAHAHSDDNTYLRIYVAQLRRKIERDPARDQFIENEPGVGYRLRAAPGTPG